LVDVCNSMESRQHQGYVTTSSFYTAVRIALYLYAQYISLPEDEPSELKHV
jgi:hypothetical protein